MRRMSLIVLVALAGSARAEPRDLIADARELLVAGACAEGTPKTVSPDVVTAHCKKVKASQASYRKSWLDPAREFFRAHVPTTIPKTVVYPFAGGDLSTALAVYPDADEITTLSLEPAGDVRALTRLAAGDVKAQLAVAASELSYFYSLNFSKTVNMAKAMQKSQLPTQLIFSLSALVIHGYEPVALRYFKLTPEGEITYLTDADLARIDQIKSVAQRNGELGNVEIKFRKLGEKREQTYRHIVANLDNKHLTENPAALRHLMKKGRVSAMTKAASYLMALGTFDTIRRYLLSNVDWMVSDTTGVAPKWGTPAGFEYEAWGKFESHSMGTAAGVVPSWRGLYKSQRPRPLKFRFGYGGTDASGAFTHKHLVIMRKPKK
ncbi:MAG TPA: hypothetical protein VIU61_13725 [Kofleriaceae bacterium]